ncbi:MAG: hypothetical protein IKI10_02960 [Muribaculaceae bacterium]|nr:hypothetical protein [Muribaculaceae bacterium]
MIGPLRGPSFWCLVPQATQTFGLCALGLLQFKASGLVQTCGLLVMSACFWPCADLRPAGHVGLFLALCRPAACYMRRLPIGIG